MYEIVSHNVVYKGKIIDVFHDEVILERNVPVIREVVDHKGASAILPIDKDGLLLLVRQYRHPALEKVLEIPAGVLEKDEDPKVCAARELEEETGFKSNNIIFLTKMYTAIGFSNEMLYIYVAKDLELGSQNFDTDEFMTIEKYTLDEAVNMIYSGEIKDSKTIVAILMYKG